MANPWLRPLPADPTTGLGTPWLHSGLWAWPTLSTLMNLKCPSLPSLPTLLIPETSSIFEKWASEAIDDSGKRNPPSYYLPGILHVNKLFRAFPERTFIREKKKEVSERSK
jgi:hypothetical protein